MAEAQIVWFRQDLRLADQPALAAAAAAGPVLPVYVLDDDTPGDWRPGGASRWWLHHSLTALAAGFEAKGARLVLLRGRAAPALAALAEAAGTRAVHAVRHHEPAAKTQQDEVAAALDLTLHDGQTLAPPDAVQTGAGGRFRIFTPFWRALQRLGPPAPPRPAPERLTMADAPAGDRLDDWGLLPTRPDWSTGFDWTSGEAAAQRALAEFAARAHAYGEGRNLPAESHTSRMSPRLHWGELSPAQVWHAAHAAAGDAAEPFLREVAWRDFALGLLDAFPGSPDVAMRPAFARFPHRDAHAEYLAWRRGQTGYPIVDAALNELWVTGWMHNRARLIASSFLVKHLLIDWRVGARWFWDTLVDADLANNTLGWQWIMGSGVDSQPFIRILDPVAQGRRWDPVGAYVRRWVPALGRVPDRFVHAPWEADAATLAEAGVKLGRDYPEPIVDHAFARRRALEAFRSLRAEP